MKECLNKKIKQSGMQYLEGIFLVVLMLYPLRHIHWGLDLWDTGYNYANFQYMGMEHMDPMWLFSTHLANVVGNLLTKLPMGNTLVGMNLYTGVFVSVLAVLGYWFCSRILNIPKWIVFLGEFTAISLCWSPTALLYNYMTYLLFLSCVILLYLGLTRENMWYLFGAGVCLGTNVLVRFPNLAEAALIVAVWVYAFLVSREAKMGAWKRCFRYTIWCLGGYLTALAVAAIYIQIRYGMDQYIEGVMRLFDMTDKATDYKPQSMIMGIVGTYVENLYWAARIGILVLGGTVVAAIASWFMKRMEQNKKYAALQGMLQTGVNLFAILLSVAMLVWLYLRKFCTFTFYSYDSMLRPGILFLMLTMLIAVIRIFHRKSPKEEKLISGILILVIFLTSIGSNNGVYPSLNNLFVAAPYTFWQSWRFVRGVKTYRWKKLVFHPLPAKCILVAFLAMFLFQITLFGANFVFVEGTGAQNVSAVVENNEVLKGVKMSPERAEWMTEISAFAEEEQLQNREVILYGKLPALSYYLQMPSAFNPWSDLDSYSFRSMERALQQVGDAIWQKEMETPVIIVENLYWKYLNGGMEAVKASNATEKQIAAMEEDEKWPLLVDFLEVYEYKEVFANEKFAVYMCD